MLVETGEFPLIRLHFDREAEGQDVFGVLDQLLSRQEHFILLSYFGRGDYDAAEYDDRRRMSLWMKAHWAELHKFVRAILYIEPFPARRASARAAASVLARLWRYPLIVVGSDKQAEDLGRWILSGARILMPA